MRALHFLLLLGLGCPWPVCGLRVAAWRKGGREPQVGHRAFLERRRTSWVRCMPSPRPFSSPSSAGHLGFSKGRLGVLITPGLSRTLPPSQVRSLSRTDEARGLLWLLEEESLQPGGNEETLLERLFTYYGPQDGDKKGQRGKRRPFGLSPGRPGWAQGAAFNFMSHMPLFLPVSGIAIGLFFSWLLKVLSTHSTHAPPGFFPPCRPESTAPQQ